MPEIENIVMENTSEKQKYNVNHFFKRTYIFELTREGNTEVQTNPV